MILGTYHGYNVFHVCEASIGLFHSTISHREFDSNGSKRVGHAHPGRIAHKHSLSLLLAKRPQPTCASGYKIRLHEHSSVKRYAQTWRAVLESSSRKIIAIAQSPFMQCDRHSWRCPWLLSITSRIRSYIRLYFCLLSRKIPSSLCSSCTRAIAASNYGRIARK